VLGGIIWLAAIFSLGKEYQLYRLPRKLITSGIYSKFRHPIYIGVEILFLGLAVFCSSFIGFVYVLIVLLPFQIARARWEEKLLIKKFGEDYLEYKTKTWF
jgi:protein-S-isoprenylcysteine O-methyltransferase Ste14